MKVYVLEGYNNIRHMWEMVSTSFTKWGCYQTMQEMEGEYERMRVRTYVPEAKVLYLRKKLEERAT